MARIRIRIKQSDPNPYQIEKPHPDRYQSEKQDPDPYQKGKIYEKRRGGRGDKGYTSGREKY
jgi:hypothetical protein